MRVLQYSEVQYKKKLQGFRMLFFFTTLVRSSKKDVYSITYHLDPLFFVYFRFCFAYLPFNCLLFFESFLGLLAQVRLVGRFTSGPTIRRFSLDITIGLLFFVGPRIRSSHAQLALEAQVQEACEHARVHVEMPFFDHAVQQLHGFQRRHAGKIVSEDADQGIQTQIR